MLPRALPWRRSPWRRSPWRRSPWRRINLPNDEQVQLQKGTRRLQLKNAMRAKFDAILVPIASELIAADQRKHVSFDAFFANTMFHEVEHGLGIKNTINGRGTVREALKEQASALEERTLSSRASSARYASARRARTGARTSRASTSGARRARSRATPRRGRGA